MATTAICRRFATAACTPHAHAHARRCAAGLRCWQERVLGQKFQVDIELGTDLAAAGRSDRLADTVNYVSVFELARAHLEGRPKALIEAVAHSLIADILEQHADVHSARVRICKPQVCIPGILEHVAVEL